MNKEIKKWERLRAIILLIILVAIGGVVLYGENKEQRPIYGTPR